MHAYLVRFWLSVPDRHAPPDQAFGMSSQGEKGKRGRGKACQRGPPGIPGLRGLDVIRHLHTLYCILHFITMSLNLTCWYLHVGGSGNLGHERGKRGARTQCTVTVLCFAGLQIYVFMVKFFSFGLGWGCEGTSDKGGGWEVWYVCTYAHSVCVCFAIFLRASCPY